MCGICGIVNFNGQAADKKLIELMSEKLAHRGPDDSGYYLEKNVGLGHRRLSIIDLETGKQPIHNEARKIWLIINGEIYNFIELRALLEKKGHNFYTKSDSEVVVHLYEEYKEACLDYLRGMFAFALWDGNEKKLFLARDRLGKKPLVYWRNADHFAFASELQALIQLPFISRKVDKQALNLYLTFLYVPAPLTMFEEVFKLPPAHYMIVKDKEVILRRYWRLNVGVSARKKVCEYKQELTERLEEAVKLRMVSDVPLGAFLSGGIDSSLIVSLMNKHVVSRLKTFSVGFSDKLYNELKYAQIIADKFQTQHYKIMIKPEAVEIIPKIIRHYGEPFADYSCIPTYYLAKFAALKVKVILTGDGGDESFAGYYRYTAASVAQAIDCMPLFLKNLFKMLFYLIPPGNDVRTARWQMKRFFKVLEYQPLMRYLNWVSAFRKNEKLELLNGDVLKQMSIDDDWEFLNRVYQEQSGIDFVDKTIKMEGNTYLPFDLLVKMDIASMANSLEVRSPFLDHKFVEYAATIPLDLKLHYFQNKYVLKKTAESLLPNKIIYRTKKGLGMPIGQWFRCELKDMMQDALLSTESINRGYFNKEYLRSLINEHMSRKTDNGFKLWALLMFELWHKEFIG
ncbi:MAG: asparagine synthase (glutamine-hydrolyzing) [Candidatus Omnitrophica bacterium]|nr:asparagine synthase (glutamine-hydrolyzing) [Candidatus Omnitrophota bacterium]